jgi:hypothetical protein
MYITHEVKFAARVLVSSVVFHVGNIHYTREEHSTFPRHTNFIIFTVGAHLLLR